MKKLAVATAMAFVGVSLAYASSLSVPWFVDNAELAQGIPHTFANTGRQSQVTGIVTLKSNRTDTVVCEITYFNQEGELLGPFAPNNTFEIQPLSGVAFRPVQCDPAADVTDLVCDDTGDGVPDRAGAAGGQDSGAGALVPKRPRSADATTPIPGAVDNQGNPLIDTRKNGAIVIEWQGGSTDVQGQVAYFQTSLVQGARVTYSYAHLLPPGV